MKTLAALGLLLFFTLVFSFSFPFPFAFPFPFPFLLSLVYRSTGPDLELQLAQRDIELSRLSEMLQRGEAQWKSATEENHRTVKILNEKIEAEVEEANTALVFFFFFLDLFRTF